MGGHIYYYAVPYESDINNALQSLRRREFEAGRYNPVVPFLEFESDASLTPSRGKQHASIQEAMEASEADGTRSILDIERVAAEPDFGVAVLLSPERLEELYGTDKPTREMVAENMDFFEDVDRGHANLLCTLPRRESLRDNFCWYVIRLSFFYGRSGLWYELSDFPTNQDLACRSLNLYYAD